MIMEVQEWSKIQKEHSETLEFSKFSKIVSFGKGICHIIQNDIEKGMA